MTGINPVLVELHCAQQDERARGKAPCASRVNANIVAHGRTATEASDRAKRAAREAGWKLKEVATNGRFRALVCATCASIMENDQ